MYLNSIIISVVGSAISLFFIYISNSLSNKQINRNEYIKYFVIISITIFAILSYIIPKKCTKNLEIYTGNPAF